MKTDIEITNVVSVVLVLERRCLVIGLIALAALALSLTARAQTGNVAYGPGALDEVITGDFNTAIGYNALTEDKSGTYNTATGGQALFANESGDSNTATGFSALFANNGSSNTATATLALYENNTGNSNTATGVNALTSNHIGSANTATGAGALFHGNKGSSNVADGYRHCGLTLSAGITRPAAIRLFTIARARTTSLWVRMPATISTLAGIISTSAIGV